MAYAGFGKDFGVAMEGSNGGLEAGKANVLPQATAADLDRETRCRVQHGRGEEARPNTTTSAALPAFGR